MCPWLLVAVLILGWLTTLAHPGWAWNKAGHMVSGAIAYAELKQASPKALSRVVELLKAHPDFPDMWTVQLNKPFVPPDERERYLFMLAARWPDDIQGNKLLDHPKWHFINLPYKPENQPARVQIIDPPPENSLSAYRKNLDIVRSSATNSERAVALCWLFHLIGDAHQPLHTVTLFSTQFPAPEGDRGGTRFSIRVREDRRTISLHEFWDDLVLGSTRFQTVRNTATELRLRLGHARRQFPELAQYQFVQWAKQESFALAKEHAYRNGALQGSTDTKHGVVLPLDYARTVKPMGERRIVLSGYRLADVLQLLFE